MAASAVRALAGLWALYQGFRLAAFIQSHFFHKSTLDRLQTPGAQGGEDDSAWALVTGATDGIGKGFAEELCARGFNVIIHGRNETKLEKVKSSLQTRWPKCQIRTLRMDASREAGDADAMARTACALQPLNLRILINNVGGSSGSISFMPLQDRTPEQIRSVLEVNVRFPTEITRALLPQLQRNGSALIMNIGSATSELSLPYLSIYSGCKGYNQCWSRCLEAEMRAENHDVEVLCILVAAVATELSPRPLSLFVPNARQMAGYALGKVGCGRGEIFGYWGHHLQVMMFRAMPSFMARKAVVDVGKKEKLEDEKRTASR
ncbi:Hypothetical predicted protein [Lecanosticta acicola]|uniref:Very-long-chain 3-oxoacyl-CoA reductase n=1 Tax=Lecanosticta acicola TaxID=111012 RepID=A0AAI8Z904_9PEZI|nr:Hypothetical predicted protein [Lecanosticta acicola]